MFKSKMSYFLNSGKNLNTFLDEDELLKSMEEWRLLMYRDLRNNKRSHYFTEIMIQYYHKDAVYEYSDNYIFIKTIIVLVSFWLK